MRATVLVEDFRTNRLYFSRKTEKLLREIEGHTIEKALSSLCPKLPPAVIGWSN
jgi:hypothetical protein